MPINYLDINKDIADIAAAYPEFQRDLNARREAARQLFAGQFDQQLLADKIRKAVSFSRNLRCAIPTAEPLNRRFPLQPDLPEKLIIAVDGSQINPSRHQAVEYFLLNIGVVIFPEQASQTPEVQRQSRLTSNMSKYWTQISEDRIASMRDLEERKVLSDIARVYGQGTGVITLTDGPLELWLRTGEGAPRKTEKEKLLDEYLDSLVELHDYKALTAGYVDKPRAMLVVETLEIGQLGPGEVDQIRDTQVDYHKYSGVTDSDLFADILVAPGDRSAVFELQFGEAKAYQNKGPELALHFFYLNVSQEPGVPAIARVEIPGWVAGDHDKVAQLQTALFRQCNHLGDVRYPYVLHRAHEEAVVTFEDREELDRRIINEFAQRGIPIGKPSNKQSAKNLQTGKRRYSHGGRKY